MDRNEFNKFKISPKNRVRYVLDNRTGCWVWALSLKNGYGQWSAGKFAHRELYILLRQSDLIGIWLHHKCENKRCVNPDHLLKTTPKEHCGLHPQSVEKRLRISKSLKGIVRSEETRQRMSQAKLRESKIISSRCVRLHKEGKIGFRKHHTEESKLKISKGMIKYKSQILNNISILDANSDLEAIDD